MEPEIRKIVTYDEEVLIEAFARQKHPGACSQSRWF